MRAGLIDVETISREGKRPERTTYRISPAGVDAFLNTLREIVATLHRESSEFMAAVSFLVHMDPKEAVRRLKVRTEKLEAEIAQRAAGLAAASLHVLRINLIESEYLLAMLKAELVWVRRLEEEIRKGKLTWSLRAILRQSQAEQDTAGKRRRR